MPRQTPPRFQRTFLSPRFKGEDKSLRCDDCKGPHDSTGQSTSATAVRIDGRALEFQFVAPGIEYIERIAHPARAAVEGFLHDFDAMGPEMRAHFGFVERAERNADMIDIAAAANRRHRR